jgi:hypothetical protein
MKNIFCWFIDSSASRINLCPQNKLFYSVENEADSETWVEFERFYPTKFVRVQRLVELMERHMIVDRNGRLLRCVRIEIQ